MSILCGSVVSISRTSTFDIGFNVFGITASMFSRSIGSSTGTSSACGTRERSNVVQLACQILRLAQPHKFPPNLLQAFAASFTATSSSSSCAAQFAEGINNGCPDFAGGVEGGAGPFSSFPAPVTSRNRDTFRRGYLMLLLEYSKHLNASY